MEVIDFVNIINYNGANGTTLGYNKIMSGITFRPDMSEVKDFDLKDWLPVFDYNRVSKFNMLVGYKATVTADISNSTALGNLISPTASDTVQLGWINQKVCLLDNIYVRNDPRDQVLVGNLDNTSDHLDYINSLIPIKYRLALREEIIEKTYPYPHPLTEPDKPILDQYNGDTVAYDKALVRFNSKKQIYDEYVTKVEQIYSQRQAAYKTLTNPIANEVRYGFNNDNLLNGLSSIDNDFNPILEHGKNNIGFDTKYLRDGFLNVFLVNAIKELTKLHNKLREDHDELKDLHDQLRLEFDEVVLEKNQLKTDMELVKTTLGI